MPTAARHGRERARSPPSYSLRSDVRDSAQGYQRGCYTFADYESLPILIERPRGFAGAVVEGGSQCSSSIKTDKGHLMDTGLGTPCEHDGGVSALDCAERVARSVGPRGTGGCRAQVGTLHGSLAGGSGTDAIAGSDTCSPSVRSSPHAWAWRGRLRPLIPPVARSGWTRDPKPNLEEYGERSRD